MSQRTKNGLPVVSEETFMKFLGEYDLTAVGGDPDVTARIESENPQIYRLLKLGMAAAPSKEARSYFLTGVHIAYELLRRQSAEDIPVESRPSR